MRRLACLSSAIGLLALGACAAPGEGPETASAALSETAAIQAALNEPAPAEASITPLPVVNAVTADAEDALVMPVTYSCEGGRSFVATFPEHGRAVTVAAAGETRVLAHRGAADTVMFADAAGATLTAEGAGATLTGMGEAYTDCMAG
ncbi:MAG: hypothetical protein M3M95_03440 [Pseudomonadota bacterium]|nr:hypothetical protein [Pseudomonadota bacterium]